MLKNRLFKTSLGLILPLFFAGAVSQAWASPPCLTRALDRVDASSGEPAINPVRQTLTLQEYHEMFARIGYRDAGRNTARAAWLEPLRPQEYVTFRTSDRLNYYSGKFLGFGSEGEIFLLNKDNAVLKLDSSALAKEYRPGAVSPEYFRLQPGNEIGLRLRGDSSNQPTTVTYLGFTRNGEMRVRCDLVTCTTISGETTLLTTEINSYSQSRRPDGRWTDWTEVSQPDGAPRQARRMAARNDDARPSRAVPIPRNVDVNNPHVQLELALSLRRGDPDVRGYWRQIDQVLSALSQAQTLSVDTKIAMVRALHVLSNRAGFPLEKIQQLTQILIGDPNTPRNIPPEVLRTFVEYLTASRERTVSNSGNHWLMFALIKFARSSPTEQSIAALAEVFASGHHENQLYAMHYLAKLAPQKLIEMITTRPELQNFSETTGPRSPHTQRSMFPSFVLSLSETIRNAPETELDLYLSAPGKSKLLDIAVVNAAQSWDPTTPRLVRWKKGLIQETPSCKIAVKFFGEIVDELSSQEASDRLSIALSKFRNDLSLIEARSIEHILTTHPHIRVRPELLREMISAFIDDSHPDRGPLQVMLYTIGKHDSEGTLRIVNSLEPDRSQTEKLRRWQQLVTQLQAIER